MLDLQQNEISIACLIKSVWNNSCSDSPITSVTYLLSINSWYQSLQMIVKMKRSTEILKAGEVEWLKSPNQKTDANNKDRL